MFHDGKMAVGYNIKTQRILWAVSGDMPGAAFLRFFHKNRFFIRF